MSRSKPTAKNPATRFFQWGGGEGKISYYDKEAEERIDVPFSKKKPFIFLVLDELNTITGFSKGDQSSVWSNEVRDMSKESLAVRTGKGLKLRGVYKEIKGELAGIGGKYAKSVYIAYKNDEGELVIGHIKLAGAALSAWIDFNKKWDVYKVAIKLEDIKAETNGATKYFVPVFAGLPVSESTNNEAKELDNELQTYLGTYFSYKPSEEEEVETVQDDEVEEEAVAAAPVKKQERKTPTKIDDGTEDGIELAELPF